MASTAPETAAFYKTVAEKAAQSDEYIRNKPKLYSGDIYGLPSDVAA